MRETPSPAFVGIDVAKHWLNVLARPAAEHWIVAHDDDALLALIRRLAGYRSPDVNPAVGASSLGEKFRVRPEGPAERQGGLALDRP